MTLNEKLYEVGNFFILVLIIIGFVLFILYFNGDEFAAGTFLTKTVSSGSSSKTMKVNDSSYFYDGYGIDGEAGDLIQLSGQSTTARILSISKTTNTLTLDRSLTWTAGQGVSLVYNGTKPDLGAYEYGQPVMTRAIGYSVWLGNVIKKLSFYI